MIIEHLYPATHLRPELGDVTVISGSWVLKCDGSACCVSFFSLPQLESLFLFSHLLCRCLIHLSLNVSLPQIPFVPLFSSALFSQHGEAYYRYYSFHLVPLCASPLLSSSPPPSPLLLSKPVWWRKGRTETIAEGFPEDFPRCQVKSNHISMQAQHPGW